jgi:hypothetical protein
VSRTDGRTQTYAEATRLIATKVEVQVKKQSKEEEEKLRLQAVK